MRPWRYLMVYEQKPASIQPLTVATYAQQSATSVCRRKEGLTQTRNLHSPSRSCDDVTSWFASFAPRWQFAQRRQRLTKKRISDLRVPSLKLACKHLL